MSEQFNNKDYGDYFYALEKSIQHNKKQPASSPQQKKVVPKGLRLRPWVYAVAALLAVSIIVVAIPKGNNKPIENKVEAKPTKEAVSDVEKPNTKKENLYAKFTDNTVSVSTEIESESVVFINCNKNEVVAARNSTKRCYPASTTKIMTILTAVDYITDYDKTFTFSYEITDPLYIQGATVAGFSNEEAVNMTDMLYGAILPSGADATIGLALSISESEQEFVKLMNKKAKELGLKNTNFTNVSGLFDENHYTTAEDMAVIVRAAMQNDLCRTILSAYEYETAPTEQHPDGITLTSTLFSYMYGTEPEGADILGGKTGFVNESGYCIASFGKNDTGEEFVCVTLKGPSLWPAVYDQIDLYTIYAK